MYKGDTVHNEGRVAQGLKKGDRTREREKESERVAWRFSRIRKKKTSPILTFATWPRARDTALIVRLSIVVRAKKLKMTSDSLAVFMDYLRA